MNIYCLDIKSAARSMSIISNCKYILLKNKGFILLTRVVVICP